MKFLVVETKFEINPVIETRILVLIAMFYFLIFQHPITNII